MAGYETLKIQFRLRSLPDSLFNNMVAKNPTVKTIKIMNQCRELRDKGLSYEQIAKLTGTHQTNVGKYLQYLRNNPHFIFEKGGEYNA